MARRARDGWVGVLQVGAKDRLLRDENGMMYLRKCWKVKLEPRVQGEEQR